MPRRARSRGRDARRGRVLLLRPGGAPATTLRQLLVSRPRRPQPRPPGPPLPPGLPRAPRALAAGAASRPGEGRRGPCRSGSAADAQPLPLGRPGRLGRGGELGLGEGKRLMEFGGRMGCGRPGVLWGGGVRSPAGRPRETGRAGGAQVGPAQVAGLGSL